MNDEKMTRTIAGICFLLPAIFLNIIPTILSYNSVKDWQGSYAIISSLLGAAIFIAFSIMLIIGNIKLAKILAIVNLVQIVIYNVIRIKSCAEKLSDKRWHFSTYYKTSLKTDISCRILDIVIGILLVVAIYKIGKKAVLLCYVNIGLLFLQIVMRCVFPINESYVLFDNTTLYSIYLAFSYINSSNIIIILIAQLIITMAGYLFLGMYLGKKKAYARETSPQKTYQEEQIMVNENFPQVEQTTENNEDGYFGIAAHVLLLIFTFFIWYFIWIYKKTEYLNRVKSEPPRNPTTTLLLCIFVPFYLIYWVYKSAQLIDILAKEKGIPSDLTTLCLILAIFIPFVPPIIMQDKINSIAKSKTRTVTNQSTVQSGVGVTTIQTGVADELKKYKDLLDSGVITQEEFDAKKKQLLNL